MQSEKALFPMEVTDDGMFMEVSFVQISKAPSPMVVTDEGMVTEVRDWQKRKASFPMEVTAHSTPSTTMLAGMTTSPVYMGLFWMTVAEFSSTSYLIPSISISPVNAHATTGSSAIKNNTICFFIVVYFFYFHPPAPTRTIIYDRSVELIYHFFSWRL